MSIATKPAQKCPKTSSEKTNRLVNMLNKVERQKLGLVIALWIVLGCVCAFSPVPLTLPPVFNTGLKELGIALIITAITTILFQGLVENSATIVQQELLKFVKDDVANKLDDLGTNIGTQTQRLIGISASLLAMDTAGISRIYAKRSEASEQIIRDIQDKKISQLDIIGISLNDFLREGDKEFHALWKIIKGYITNPMSRKHKLIIRILIIDPNCYGAYLRSRGELRGAGALPERLVTDAKTAATHLAELTKINQIEQAKIENEASDELKDGGVSFEFRLYQLPPGLFLIRTNTTSYIQPYYFWAARDADASMPLLRCDYDSDQHPALLHDGMKDHFDLIWYHAAITSHAFQSEYNVGVDKGIHQCGIVNIFDNSDIARRRIQWLLEHAKHNVDIQGISLHSFFDGGALQKELQRLAKKGDVEIRVLFLDPDSQQASYRSFREYLLKKGSPEMTFGQFEKVPDRLHDRLHNDTRGSIEQAASIACMSQIFQARLYKSAPYCFILRVDDTVLVEQYNYGKLGKDFAVASPSLGKDMALIEYTRDSKDVYEQDSVWKSFDLIADHFNFVFEKCSKSIDFTTMSVQSYDIN
jgi:hypothetical protein